MNFMEFDKSRLYSATNADELKEGSKVIPADNLIQLERRIKKGNCTIYILERIHSSGFLTHCFICRNSRNNRVSVFNLVYLVSPPDDAGTAGKSHFCNEEKDSANPVFFVEEDHLMVTSNDDKAKIKITPVGKFSKLASNGKHAKITTSGCFVGIATNGDNAGIFSSGEYVKISSGGMKTEIISHGDKARIASGGEEVNIFSVGNRAKIASGGEFGNIRSDGNYAQIASSGDCEKIASNGRRCVICCSGSNSVAKAKTGSWITLAEWGEKNGRWIPLCVKSEYVDGEKIKEDTWYELEGGNFKEVQDEILEQSAEVKLSDLMIHPSDLNEPNILDLLYERALQNRKLTNGD